MAKRKYIDFKLFLTGPINDQVACRVSLLPTTEVGESVFPVSVSSKYKPDPTWLAELADKTITVRNLVALGKQLAHCLLPEDGDIRSSFKRALEKTGTSGGVRLRLIIADNALRQWPWEYVYLNLVDGTDSERGYLALDPRISIFRHEPLPHPHTVIPKADADITDLRMLVAAALPEGERELDLDKEIDIIKQAVKGFELEGVRITCDPILADTTIGELEKSLRHAQSIYIFHFAGHGEIESERDQYQRGRRERSYLLLLSDKVSRKAYKLHSGHLADMLQRAGVRLAVLGACLAGARSEHYPWDSVAGALLAHDIPAVIAMQHEIIDTHAIEFSETLYTALGSGLSLDEAMTIARKNMFLTDLPVSEAGKVNVEWGVPVLYSRLAEGRLFPERMANAGQAANELRKMIRQDVESIQAGGLVIGVKAKRVKGSVEISQSAKEVKGRLIGLVGSEITEQADIHIGQEAETVDGEMIGGEFEEL